MEPHTNTVVDQKMSHEREDSSTQVTPSSRPHTVTDEIRQTVTQCLKRSSSCVETKYKCTITSERLAQLRKNVEIALKEHKIFTIKGCWPVIRRELLSRNWIEKFESNRSKSATVAPVSPNSNNNLASEDLTSNLPAKQEWESPTAYVQKCERTVMSRMLQSYDVDLYWSMRKDHSDLQHRTNNYKLINRFCRSLFASKEGLALLLQQAYWHTESGVSHVNFPRCYVLGFPDHFSYFVDDFRLTACMGMLKWFTNKYENEDKYSYQSPEGAVPYSALQFALDRCSDYLMKQKHIDIDKDEERTWDHEWEQFLTNYAQIMYQNLIFLESKKYNMAGMYNSAKSILNELKSQWPEIDIDGMRNIWIMKPGNKCRGRGIQLIKNIGDVERIMNLKLKYVVQKYIEKPLIIYKTKFDIRQWFIITSVQPLSIWMYRDSYLRFSSQNFSLENFHESLHLTNHAVQCKYKNMEQRDDALPSDNMWDCHKFKDYLAQNGHAGAWETIVYPGMREAIICAMLCSQDTMDRRQNTFEVYGADFMLSEDLKPWLLEINCSPDLSSSTSVTKKMCPRCMEDIIKVVVDRRRDPRADTGLFDLIYRQNLPRTPPYLGMNLCIRGRRLFKSKKLKQLQNDKENEHCDVMPKFYTNRQLQTSHIENSTFLKELPNILSADLYKGPVIQDLIENLHKHASLEDKGVKFIPSNKNNNKKQSSSVSSTKKKPNTTAKRERVSKKERYSHNQKLNKPSFSRKPNKPNVSRENNKETEEKREILVHESVSPISDKLPTCQELRSIGGAIIWDKNGIRLVQSHDGIEIKREDSSSDRNNNNTSDMKYENSFVTSVNNTLPEVNANTNKNASHNLSFFSLDVGIKNRNIV